MKKSASKRNRHTGKVNAYKQSILDNGTRFKDSRGVEYVGLKLSQRGMSVVKA